MINHLKKFIMERPQIHREGVHQFSKVKNCVSTRYVSGKCKSLFICNRFTFGVVFSSTASELLQSWWGRVTLRLRLLSVIASAVMLPVSFPNRALAVESNMFDLALTELVETQASLKVAEENYDKLLLQHTNDPENLPRIHKTMALRYSYEIPKSDGMLEKIIEQCEEALK
jgi:hypothetical protein